MGYDLSTNELALRSGAERRQRGRARYLRSHLGARRPLGSLVLLPDQLPADADETVPPASGLERVGRLDEAALAYGAILRRWPDISRR